MSFFAQEQPQPPSPNESEMSLHDYIKPISFPCKLNIQYHPYTTKKRDNDIWTTSWCLSKATHELHKEIWWFHQDKEAKLVLRVQSEQVIGFTKSLLNALEPRCPVVSQTDPPTTQSKSTQTPSMKPTQTIAIQTTPPWTKTTSTQTDIPKPLPMKGAISSQTPPSPKPAKSTPPDIRHLLLTKPSWTTTKIRTAYKNVLSSSMWNSVSSITKIPPLAHWCQSGVA